MTSGGTNPSTRSITNSGTPVAVPWASDHHICGTGTDESSPTRRITSNWRSRSYVGNTGTSVASGATRATRGSWRLRPSSVHSAVNRIVSLDIPLADVASSWGTLGP